MSFQNYWNDRGHLYGHCLIDPSNSVNFVNIPKCASSYTKDMLTPIGWRHHNFISYPEIQPRCSIITLRDPIDRWVSGICEYFFLYHRTINSDEFTNAFYDLLMDRITFDDHTEKQIYFIDGLDLAKCKFLMCDSNYGINLAKIISSHGYTIGISNKIHETKSCTVRSKFKTIFSPLLENPKYYSKLKDHFADDYKLIESINKL